MYLTLHQEIEAWSELRGARLGALTIGSCGYCFCARSNASRPRSDRDVEIVGLGPRYPEAID